MRKRYGRKRRFRVVEDGDTKGFQSGKGVAAKQEQKIQSWKLPPRTPSWMPHRLLPLAANREAGLVEPGRQAFGRQEIRRPSPGRCNAFAEGRRAELLGEDAQQHPGGRRVQGMPRNARLSCSARLASLSLPFFHDPCRRRGCVGCESVSVRAGQGGEGLARAAVAVMAVVGDGGGAPAAAGAGARGAAVATAPRLPLDCPSTAPTTAPTTAPINSHTGCKSRGATLEKESITFFSQSRFASCV